MMMKRILAFMIAGILILSLAACGSTVDPKDVPGTKESEMVGEAEESKEALADASTDDESAATEEHTHEPAIDLEAPDVTGRAEEVAPSLDLSGCDTFTQIIDKKFTPGMGYANEKVGDTDVFFASSGTYDNLDGNFAAIDATLLIYKDNAPYEIGKIASGGTAYPITIAGDAIYTGSNHWMCKYVIENDTLILDELAYVNYDTNGNGTYGYEHRGKAMNFCSEDAEKALDVLFDEMMQGTVVGFSTVS